MLRVARVTFRPMIALPKAGATANAAVTNAAERPTDRCRCLIARTRSPARLQPTGHPRVADIGVGRGSLKRKPPLERVPTSSSIGFQRHGEEVPPALDPLQLAGPAITEAEVRPRHDVPDGFGDENLAAPGRRHHSRRDVNRDAAQEPVVLTDLTDVKAGANLEVEFPRVVLEPSRGADRADGALERRHEPVAGPVDDAAAVRAYGMLGGPVIVRKELAPPLVAE